MRSRVQPIRAILHDMTDDIKIIVSPLSGSFTRDGITVDVLIYRLDVDTSWILEVVDGGDASTVWDDQFATDQVAHEVFLATVESEGLAQIISAEPTTLH